MYSIKLFVPTIMFFLLACSVFQGGDGNGGAAQEEALAKADIEGFLPNTVKGTLYFNLVEQRGLVIRGEIEGLLPESTYAIHIMNGTCDSPSATLDDFDPGNAQQHGPPWLSPGQHRAGVLPNIQANSDGKAEVEIEASSLDAVEGSQFSVLERGIVIFSGPDDFETGPTGEKIACGKIETFSPPQ